MINSLKVKLKKNKTIYNKFLQIKYKYCIYKGKIYYELSNKYIKNKFNFNDFDKTVNYIIENKCSVSRFGDGELNMIFYEYNIGFQSHNRDLSKRLVEIINNNNSNNHIVCIPGIFNNEMKLFTKDAQLFWYTYFMRNRDFIINSINSNNIYYETHLTRPYIIYKDKTKSKEKFDKLKQIWEKRDLLIVEGETSRLGVGNDLFKNSKSIQRILCPGKDAFSSYSEIFKVSKNFGKDKLILIALGPTATVLAYDLALEGYQAIDIGHIDVEYEWFLLGATEKVVLKNKYVNEVKNGNKVEDVNDEIYNSQIIYRIEG